MSDLVQKANMPQLRIVDADTIISGDDTVIEIDPSGADINVTLATAESKGQGGEVSLYIPEENASGFGANILTQGSDTIDSSASSISAGVFVRLSVSGTHYRRIG